MVQFRQGGSGIARWWKVITRAITRPPPRWLSGPANRALGWWEALREFPIFKFADIALIAAEDQVSLQSRRRALLRDADGYGVPFSSDPLAVLHQGRRGMPDHSGRLAPIGPSSRSSASPPTIGVHHLAMLAREKATTGVWNHRLLCSRRIPQAGRLQRLYSTARGVFLFGGRGIDTWRPALITYKGETGRR